MLEEEGHGQRHGSAVEEGQEEQDVQGLEEPLRVVEERGRGREGWDE